MVIAFFFFFVKIANIGGFHSETIQTQTRQGEVSPYRRQDEEDERPAGASSRRYQAVILNVYNIRDERVGSYGTPIVTDKNAEQVAADYQTSVDRLAANIERFQQFAPEKAAELLLTSASLKDCVIYQVGTFDNKSGRIETFEPVMVCRVSDFYREVNKNA